MNLVKLDPFREVGSIRNEVDQIFDSFFGRFPIRRRILDSVWVPLVDIEETKDHILVRTELPGMKKEEITISLNGDHLFLSGERKQEKEVKDKTYLRIERSYGRFERVVPLSTEIEKDKVKATYQDGVLEVIIPKAEKVKLKEIDIEVK